MGYLGRRIGLSQGSGNSTPGGADGAVGGGILDLFAQGYFNREGNIYNAPGTGPSGMTATGGVISDYTDGPTVYRSHVFTSSGAFSVSALGSFPANVEFLVVAGGGGGGGSRDNYAAQGGGGAGGLITNVPGVATPGPSPNPNVSLTRSSVFDVSAGGTYPVTVGAGGIGGVYPANGLGNAGNNSVLTHPSSPKTITATGGGGGAGGTNVNADAGSGGSGGGGAGYYNKTAADASPNSNPDRQGHPGGNGAEPASNKSSGGGGGGAGGPGETGVASPSPQGAKGGLGVELSIAGITTAYAGGGGSGAYFNPRDGSWGPTAPANSGGGASGGVGGGTGLPLTRGGNGTSGTGGGGGGAAAHHPPAGPRRGGNGASGVVVVRYQIGSITGNAKATGGNISFYNNKTIHVFTSTGTFVNPASIDNVEVVMVAGGGAGGNNIGGGGGAGAVLESPGTGFTFPNNTYTVKIGAGGGGIRGKGPATPGTATDTTISYPGPHTWTAQRGGYGASYPNVAAQSGGSGGAGASGQASGQAATAANSPTPIGTLTAYGFAGGSAPGNYSGAGGGGAGGLGADIPSGGVGGNAGVGRQLPTTFRNPVAAPSNTTNPAPYQRGGGLGTPGPSPGGFYVAGGGGGAAYDADVPGNRGLGGAGGGGDGAWHTESPPNTDGQSALENTGSGGGGAGYSSTNESTSGSGGSGIVLIAYPT